MIDLPSLEGIQFGGINVINIGKVILESRFFEIRSLLQSCLDIPSIDSSSINTTPDPKMMINRVFNHVYSLTSQSTIIENIIYYST